jgi:conjugative relaxase-like TrwC/TraI family protein
LELALQFAQASLDRMIRLTIFVHESVHVALAKQVPRRPFAKLGASYDFTFSVPKSVSLYLAVNDDKVVEELIAEALDETMAEIEARMETKIRKGYQQENRVSPNMIYAKFVHSETRPVDGKARRRRLWYS